MTWSVLLPVLIRIAAEKLGPLAAKLLEKLLTGKIPGTKPLAGDALPPDATTAKDVLKEFVQKLIRDQIASITMFPDSLKAVLAQIADRLDGYLFDLVWNRLFTMGMVKSTEGVSVHKAMALPPLDVPPEAEDAYFAEFGEPV